MLNNLIGAINHLDILIFYLININMQNPVFDIIMPFISSIGYFSIWIIVCVLIYIFGGEKGKNIAVVCIVALVFGYFLTEILKYIVARPRPFAVLDGVRVLSDINGSSWPSGHTVASFIGATVIGKGYGYPYLLIFLAFACLVGFSRIYNGLHYPSDVISGALIGLLCAFLALRFQDNIIANYNSLKQHIQSKK